MANIQRGKQLRRRILRYLLERERMSGSELPGLDEIAHDLGVRKEDISDQLDILEEQGAIVANRTFGGNVAPMLKGKGKAMLEELEEETSLGGTPAQEQGESSPALEDEFEWDAFISHAAEDKESFVRELAQKLIEYGVHIWYDEFTLRVGDSLRQSIDKGLVESRYGIVVLSPSFFAKDWPQKELNGLVVRERHGAKVILPVWLDVSKEDVAQYSPPLADRLAAKANEGMQKVIGELLLVLKPTSSAERKGSTEGKREKSMEQRDTDSRKLTTPKLLSTTVYYSVEQNNWESMKGEMFAALVNWVEYEQVEDKGFILNFPGGTFRFTDMMPVFTLLPGNLPLRELVQKFGKLYHMIEFKVDEQFNLGDLVRRSRGGVRQIESLSRHTITLLPGNVRARLTIKNTDEGSTVTIETTAPYYAFLSGKPPISYATVLGYLEKDPPSEELATLLRDAIH